MCENSGVVGKKCKGMPSELTETLGNRALSYRTVARRAAAFQRGRVASADMRRTGRSRTVRTDVARAVIAQCLEDDRRWSLKELQAHTVFHCYLETLQHLGHIASRIFWCVSEGCVFLLFCSHVSFVKFTDLIFMIYEFDK